MDDKYHAGLWRSELATELLWRRNSLTDAGALCPRPPSRSWAKKDQTDESIVKRLCIKPQSSYFLG